MKKILGNVLLAAALACATTAYAGSEGRNGGGGIERNGMVLTFGSAGYHIGLDPLEPEDVPGMDRLHDAIRALPLSSLHHTTLLEAIIPTETRRYFKIAGNQLGDLQKAALFSAYQKAIGQSIPNASLRVFAVTSPSTRETYLLPDFFRLGTAEQQAAILLHESVWTMGQSDYSYVMRLEEKFQAYLEHGSPAYDQMLYPLLDDLLKDHFISVKAALIADWKSGALKDLIVNGKQLRVLPLFGSMPNLGNGYYFNVNGNSLLSQLDEALVTHPQSLALQRLEQVADFIRSDQSYGRIKADPTIDLSALTSMRDFTIDIDGVMYGTYENDNAQLVITK